MRSRMIKPDFWGDEKLAMVSREARLLFIGLWNLSDDYGYTKGNPIWIKSQLFPYDEKLTSDTVSRWVSELERIGCIVGYTVSGEKYYNIKHFLDHQRVDRPSSTRNPLPLDEGSTSTQGGLDAEYNRIEENIIKENRREEKEISASPSVSEVIQLFNRIVGTKYTDKTKSTNSMISARLSEGFSISDFETVIRKKQADWGNDPNMIKFLRPQTLFQPSKFESYLNEGRVAPGIKPNHLKTALDYRKEEFQRSIDESMKIIEQEEFINGVVGENRKISENVRERESCKEIDISESGKDENVYEDMGRTNPSRSELLPLGNIIAGLTANLRAPSRLRS